MSLFKQFITLRDRLAEIASNNVDFLNKIIDPTVTTIVDPKVPVSGDRTLAIQNGYIQLFDKTNVCVAEVELTADQDVNFNNFKNTIDQATGDSIADMIDSVSQGANLYQLAADLTSKFSYSSRVSYSDIVNYINDYPVENSSALKENLFAATNDEGFITKTAFISVLDNWLKAGKSAADADSFDVDKTNPYGLSNVVNIVLSVAAQIFSTVCFALSTVLGGVLLIVSSLFNLLATMFTSMIEVEHIEYDTLAGNNYVAGPIYVGDPVGSEAIVVNDSNRNNNVWLSECHGIGFFLWKTGVNSYRANAYLYPCYKGLDLLWDLLDDGQIVVENPWTVSSRTTFPEPTTILAFGDSSTYQYNDHETPVSSVEIAISLAMGHLIQTARAGLWNGDSDEAWILNGASYLGLADDEKLVLSVNELINYVEFLKIRNYSKTDILKDAQFITDCDNFANLYANYLKSYNIPNRTSLFMRAQDWNEVTVMDTNHSFNFPMLYSIMAGHDAFIRQGMASNITIDFGYLGTGKSWYQADCLPTAYGVRLPAFDQLKVNSILAIAAISITLTTIAATQIKKIVVKRGYSKQALRANEVNEARAAFLSDPTNSTLRSAYENKVYRYNKLGKWFGWGSYDGANGWIDYTGDANSVNSQYNARALYENQSLIKEVKALIKTE